MEFGVKIRMIYGVSIGLETIQCSFGWHLGNVIGDLKLLVIYSNFNGHLVVF